MCISIILLSKKQARKELRQALVKVAGSHNVSKVYSNGLLHTITQAQRAKVKIPRRLKKYFTKEKLEQLQSEYNSWVYRLLDRY